MLGTKKFGYYVECRNTFTCGLMQTKFSKKIDSAEAWNRRVCESGAK